jgi:hypothetical protein
MTLCWAYRRKDAVAAQAVNIPSVDGVRLVAGPRSDRFERLELLVLCEEDRGLAIIDMSTGYRYWRRRQWAELRLWRSFMRSVAFCNTEYSLAGKKEGGVIVD